MAMAVVNTIINVAASSNILKWENFVNLVRESAVGKLLEVT